MVTAELSLQQPDLPCAWLGHTSSAKKRLRWSWEQTDAFRAEMHPKKLPQREEGMILGVNISLEAKPCYSETSIDNFLLS